VGLPLAVGLGVEVGDALAAQLAGDVGRIHEAASLVGCGPVAVGHYGVGVMVGANCLAGLRVPGAGGLEQQQGGRAADKQQAGEELAELGHGVHLLG
jgi:hypothetical protein